MLKDCLVSQGRAPAGPPGRLPGENVPGRTRTGNIGRPQEPIWFYYNKANQSILLVPWNRFQYQGLQTEAFILLLHKLGFQLPADVGKVFPRLDFLGKQGFCHHHIYSVAVKPGPVETRKLKFLLEELEKLEELEELEELRKLKFSLEELERITAAPEEPAMPLRRPSTEKNLSECQVRGVFDIRQLY